jgi:hypothetical protein
MLRGREYLLMMLELGKGTADLSSLITQRCDSFGVLLSNASRFGSIQALIGQV